MKLKTPSQNRAPISLVAMIDVLMIMLVFFMVTSTYLHLQMIPVAQSTPDRPVQSGGTPASTAGETPAHLLIRLAADGTFFVRGRQMPPDALSRLLSDRLAKDQDTRIVVLPSGAASTQRLVSLLDTVSATGVRRLRIVRLEERR